MTQRARVIRRALIVTLVLGILVGMVPGYFAAGFLIDSRICTVEELKR